MTRDFPALLLFSRRDLKQIVKHICVFGTFNLLELCKTGFEPLKFYLFLPVYLIE